MKQFKMLKLIVDFHREAEDVVNGGTPIFKITQLPVIEEIMRMKTSVPNDKVEQIDDLSKRVQDQLLVLEAQNLR